MHKFRLPVFAILFAVCSLTGWIFLGDRSKKPEKADAGKEHSKSETQAIKDNISQPSSNPGEPLRDHRTTGKSTKADTLSRIIADYDALIKKFGGEELRRQKMILVGLAAGGLSPSDTCLLLDHVSGDLGDDMGQLAHIVGGAMSMAQESPGSSEELQAWVLKVENPTFKVELLKVMGRFYSGSLNDPMPFYQKMELKSEKDFFLAGFLGKFTGPFRSPVEWLAKFSLEAGTYPNLVETIKNLPASCDVSAIPQYLGSGENSLPSDVVGALIGKWAETSPLAAAQFVSNAKVDNIIEALGTMMDSSSPNLLSLMNAWESTPEKDETISVMLQHSDLQSPQLAWDLGLQVGDAEKREALLTGIFQKWAKDDKQAANAAWDKLR